eukprot:6967751-Pyramimonas_sp.AAC.1
MQRDPPTHLLEPQLGGLDSHQPFGPEWSNEILSFRLQRPASPDVLGRAALGQGAQDGTRWLQEGIRCSKMTSKHGSR